MTNRDWFIMWIAWITILAMQAMTMWQIRKVHQHERISPVVQQFKI